MAQLPQRACVQRSGEVRTLCMSVKLPLEAARKLEPAR